MLNDEIEKKSIKKNKKIIQVNPGQRTKLTPYVMRPTQPNRKQIKTNYKTQLSINLVLKKNFEKKII